MPKHHTMLQQVKNLKTSGGSSAMGWLMIGLLFVCMGFSQADTISRVNYGVLFEETGSVWAIYDFWPHTFQIPFPNLTQSETPSPNNISCAQIAPRQLEACHTMQAALQNVNEVRAKYMSNLQQSLALAKGIMPSESWNDTTSLSRSKRALLPFVGDLARALFGTATEKEVRQIAKHIDVLEKRNERMTQAFAQYTDDLSSFMTLSNRKHSLIRDTIQDNRDAISAIADDFADVTSSVSHNMQFNVLLIKEIYMAMSMQEALQEFLHGIHGLLQHKISPYLLPYEDIEATMEHINHRLKTSRSRLSVKGLTPRTFYTSSNFIWTFRNDSLFITVKFPLVSNVSHLDVFKVFSVPVPFNVSSNHTTQLVDLPPYVAFTRDRKYYTFPTENIWEQSMVNVQEYNLPLHPIREPSCTTAIFNDDKAKIREMCDFKIQVNAMKPTITHINAGQYLVSNVSHIFLQCPMGAHYQTGCQFCIFTVPCLCDISGGTTYFPPRVNHCLNRDDRATAVHPINLAVLLYVFKDYDVTHIYGDSTYLNIPDVQSRTTPLFRHNLTALLARDRDLDLSLQRIADAMANDKLIFETLSDPVLEPLDTSDAGGTFSMFNVTAIGDTILTAVLCVIVVILGVKVYSMSKVVNALSKGCRVESKDSLLPLWLMNQALLPKLERSNTNITTSASRDTLGTNI